MEKLIQTINQGVILANAIRDKYSSEYGNDYIQEVQTFTKSFIDEYNIAELVQEALKKEPHKRQEILKRFIAFHREGKHLEDSLLK